MVQKLIALCGLQGQGKNSVANVIAKHEDNWELVSFAKVLKDAVSVMFGWDRDMIEGVTEESRAWRETPDEYWSSKFGRPFTPRLAMQEFGTNLIREQWLADFWVAALERYIINSNKNIIITDCRYPNEMEMVKRLGGQLWLTNVGELPYYWNAICEYNKTGKIHPDELVTEEEILKIHRSERDWIKPVNEFDVFINPPYKDLKLLEDLVMTAYEQSQLNK